MEMYKVQDTFFKEVKRERYDTFQPCSEIVVFKTKDGTGSGYEVPSMLCDAFGILWVKGGTVRLSVNYSTEVLEENSMAFFTPNMVLSLCDADADFVLKGVCFTPAYFDDLSAYVPVYNQMTAYLNDHVLPVRKMEEAERRQMEMLLELYSTIHTRQLHYNGTLLHLSNLLLLCLAETLRTGCASDTSKVSHPVEIYRAFRKLLIHHGLKEHYIPFYASQLNVSATYLSRIVRRISGRSVNGHIAHMLTTEARRLLDCTDLPVKQIAYKLGFADQASFGKFFRNQFGTSPTNYRSSKHN